MSTDYKKLSEDLVGTCNELVGLVPDEELFNAEDRLLDEEVERCNGCEWWFDISELDDDRNCEHCREN